MSLLSRHRALLLLVIALLAGCTLNNSALVPQQTISGAPVVSILSPQPNATYLEGVVVNIQATISNAGKDIDRVEVVIDGQTIATLSTPNPTGATAFNVTHGWSASGDGTHNIGVTAYRADGSSSAPAAVQITVMAGNGQSSNGQPTNVAAPTNAAPTQANSSSAPTASGANATGANATGATTQANNPSATPVSAATSGAPASASPTSTTPTASFTQGINVRSGPGLNFDPPIGAFAAGQSAQIVALSMDGTWYKVQYGGGTGWVYAALSQASGDLASLPRDPGPPTPLPTAIPPTPVPAQPTSPPSSANLVAGIVELSVGQPTCQQTFNIGLDVANLGSEATSASGTVSVQDIRAADGSVQQTTIGGFPVLQPNQTFRVNMPFTVSTYYNEKHTIILIIDPDNQIPESNEGDNRREVDYTLQKGSCP